MKKINQLNFEALKEAATIFIPYFFKRLQRELNELKETFEKLGYTFKRNYIKKNYLLFSKLVTILKSNQSISELITQPDH